MPKVNDEFESLEAFEDAAKSAAKYRGFAFSRKDSNLTEHNSKSPFVVLQYTKEETQKRKKDTKRDSCPVCIRVTATKCQLVTDIQNTEIMWVVMKAIFKHNHSMLESEEVATFPQYRSMSLSQKILVKQLHDNNAPTQVITAAVNKTIDGGIILSKDIINEHARIRLALNKGYNNDSTQTLLRLFKEHDYMVVALKTAKGYLTHLFFSHIEAAKCVAKSLYQIVMAWIEDKSEASYTWFLQTLRKRIYNAYIFPETDRMLCVWHLLEQNLKVNCRKLFKTDNDYEAFKKEVEALRFTEKEEEIPQALNAIEKAAKKGHSSEKIELYI
ncbi:812_t:CDS:2 [Gigaspora margarita]|uniref:812_t:CDS:1 n=1 Tax=Gigaspora margarita TaxID=4874 RepID=A0ABN7VVV1_GIGMA|nr:812_t:CDS:2 [Gigaspora margarita]